MGTIFLERATFQELINCPSIQSNVDFAFHNTNLPKMENLYKLLAEYSNVVNPFGNSDLKIKEPGNHFKDVETYLEVSNILENFTGLRFSTNTAHASFTKNEFCTTVFY